MDLQKRWMNVLLVVEILALVVILGFGAVSYGSRLLHKDSNMSGQESDNTAVDRLDEEKTTEENLSETKPAFSNEVISLLANMTMDEKVAQLFVITPEALTGAEQVTVARSMSQDAFKKYPVGGLVFSPNNYTDNVQFKSLLDGYQGFSRSVLGAGLFLFGNNLSEGALRQGVNIGLTDLLIPSSFDVEVVAAMKEEAGEDTLVISGDLSSEEILTAYEEEDAAIAAVKSGVELLYNPVDFKATYDLVLEAVRSGEIESEVLEQAVGRILTIKLK